MTQTGNSASLINREVTLLYQSFLTREPEPAGLAFWITQPLQNLGVAFYTSDEYRVVQLNLVQGERNTVWLQAKFRGRAIIFAPCIINHFWRVP